MKRSGLVTIALRWLCLSASGCATPMVARYIYQDAEFGVVGIPVNNYQKKTDFRAQAEGLMSRHFPEGYEIVRARRSTKEREFSTLAVRPRSRPSRKWPP